jgi:hypothetical protein
MKDLTTKEAVKVTKALAKQREESRMHFDLESEFSYASDHEVKAASAEIRKKFSRTIRELATR